jgi:hypothetical protein
MLPTHAARVGLTLVDLGADPVGVIVGRLSPGHTPADVAAAIAEHVSTIPNWLTVVLRADLPGGHRATWGVDLTPGGWVVIGGGPSTPVVQLVSGDVSH